MNRLLLNIVLLIFVLLFSFNATSQQTKKRGTITVRKGKKAETGNYEIKKRNNSMIRSRKQADKGKVYDIREHIAYHYLKDSNSLSILNKKVEEIKCTKDSSIYIKFKGENSFTKAEVIFNGPFSVQYYTQTWDGFWGSQHQGVMRFVINNEKTAYYNYRFWSKSNRDFYIKKFEIQDISSGLYTTYTHKIR